MDGFTMLWAGAGFLALVLGVAAIVAVKMGIPLSELLGDEKKGGRADLKAYVARGSVLTAAELAFYRVLREVVADAVADAGAPDGGERAVVLCKVRAADLVGVKKGLGRSGYQAAFNRIKSKHVDFVLADPRDLSVLCVIELDDASHGRRKVRERDALMDSIYGAVGVPVVHVPCRAGYRRDEVAGVVWGAVTK